MPWDDGLDGAAREFAASGAPTVRALAGPGTGKTFALLRRVARMLEGGAEPREVLVLTFARTAAQDLVAVLRRLEHEQAEDIRVGTLHAFCFSMLSRDGVLQATGRTPRIVLDFERRTLLLDLDGPFPSGITARDDLRLAFEAAWARLQAEEPGAAVDGLDQQFQDALLASLRWHKATLIGEVVPIALSYLRHNPHAEDRTRFRHVLVDEYQDLNKAEQTVIDLLCEEADLTVVGDDDQSIYRFKSANPEGIREFTAAHPGTRDVQFTECRRCPEVVVEMAQALIQRNPGRVRGALHARYGNPPGEVHNVHWESIEKEAEGVASFIEREIDHGVDPGQCLVLAPTRHVGYPIRDAMRRRGVEVRSFFREEAVDSESTRCALTLLTLLAKPDDRVALRAWLSFGSSTQRRGPYRRVLRVAHEEGTDIADVLTRMDAGSLEVPYAGSLLDPWRELQAHIAELAPLAEDRAALCDVLFPPGDGIEEDNEFGLLREAALQVVDEAEDIVRFSDLVRYRIAQPEVPIETPYARVMSFHKSKGLTADLLVLAGLIQGAIPRIDERDTQAEQTAQLEEQRRLFFVGMTRTTNILVFSSYATLDFATAKRLGASIGARVRGRGRNAVHRVVASQFLEELGPRLARAVRGQAWEF